MQVGLPRRSLRPGGPAIDHGLVCSMEGSRRRFRATGDEATVLVVALPSGAPKRTVTRAPPVASVPMP